MNYQSSCECRQNKFQWFIFGSEEARERERDREKVKIVDSLRMSDPNAFGPNTAYGQYPQQHGQPQQGQRPADPRQELMVNNTQYI